ncbi:MAG: hypothetical protein MZV63_25960 [Marinilabiliales bacterium]|nr:hypothetical protein [Marinilabiliales bacterium]
MTGLSQRHFGFQERGLGVQDIVDGRPPQVIVGLFDSERFPGLLGGFSGHVLAVDGFGLGCDLTPDLLSDL